LRRQGGLYGRRGRAERTCRKGIIPFSSHTCRKGPVNCARAPGKRRGRIEHRKGKQSARKKEFDEVSRKGERKKGGMSAMAGNRGRGKETYSRRNKRVGTGLQKPSMITGGEGS